MLSFQTKIGRTSARYILGVVVTLSVGGASAAVVTLTPPDINQGDTNTTSYSDANVTLTPFIGATPATFNDGANWLGIDDQSGTNPNSFNDIDTDPDNGNEEQLQMVFQANAGLSQITWQWSRADGPDGGVEISGFTGNPCASLGGVAEGLPVTYNDVTKTLRFEIPAGLWSGNTGSVNLADTGASQGATLMVKVFDADQAGAQLSISSLSYDDAAASLVDADGDGVVCGDVCPDTQPGALVDSEGRPIADLNGDCRVDLADFAIVQLSYDGQ